MESLIDVIFDFIRVRQLNIAVGFISFDLDSVTVDFLYYLGAVWIPP